MTSSPPTAVVLATREDKPITTLATSVTNQDGLVVLDGTAVVWRDPTVSATHANPTPGPGTGTDTTEEPRMTITTDKTPLNGVDTATLFAHPRRRQETNEIAKFQFRATTPGCPARTAGPRFAGFYGAMQELQHEQETVVESDHPAVLVGTDDAPTPVEYLLHAIAACLTAGIANIAAARGVRLTHVSSNVEGDIDLLGILGLSGGSVRNGYEQIKVTFHVEGDADDADPARHRRAVPSPLRRLRRAHQPHARRDRRRHGLTTRPRQRPAGPHRPAAPGRLLKGHLHDHLDTVVVGAGHAGLAVSKLLTDAGRDHVVLDRGRIGERWRSERWDSLHLLTPSWMTRLPGWSYSGPDPDGYLSAGSVRRPPRCVRRLVRRARRRAARPCSRSRRRPGRRRRRYQVDTSRGTWHARHVVIATGPHGTPYVPAGLAGSPRDSR